MQRIVTALISFVCFLLVVFIALAFCKTYAYCISRHTHAWKTLYRKDYHRIIEENNDAAAAGSGNCNNDDFDEAREHGVHILIEQS
ncbi:hypothetical protein GJ496_000864 [Pomphorhynchus laevis]|nr:hypothetical protein GJ496_000864 [Pomphorhynchus laevis]